VAQYNERRIAGLALVIGALLFLVANLVHPKEYASGDGNEADQLAEIAEHYTRWQFAHFLTFLSLFAIAAAVALLALVLWRRDQRAGLAGGILGISGLLALMGVLALDGFAWGIAGEVWGRPEFDRATAEQILEDLQNSEWALPFYLTPVAWILGMVVLALGLWRTRILPAWAGWALAIGAIAVGLEGAIQSNTYFIIASLVFLAGALAVAATLRPAPA
jgi:hypothetical protein